ncbi:FliA/WhiG family RNA polymerase sigma factor [Bacillaceae bacterium Marseille-Q3522]|nr:FliA/WhiG family RNA polymerase sigma factor [Bacillaceae bacterium Marseille-Q3522]
MVYDTMLDERIWWEKWIKDHDADAGNFLVKKYLPLVSYHVQRISTNLPKSVSRDDIKSLALFGLYDALEKFDPNRELKFDTYASFRIRGAIIDGLRKEDWLPRSTREKAKKIEMVTERLEQKYQRSVTANEVAAALAISEEEVYTATNEHFFANLLSMDEYLPDQDEQEGHSFHIKDEKAELPEESLLQKEILQEIAGLIETLNEKEKQVLSLFYQEELTLTEIGQVMGLSTSRISQIHSKAIYKLRQKIQKWHEV